MEHAYQIDIVTELITRLGGSNPVFFQRDHQFYVASSAGFGWVGHGLSTHPKNAERLECGVDKEDSEILESKDITYIEQPKEKYQSAKRRVIKQELRRVQPLLFGEDDDMFSLESMAKTAEALQNLPDDGKIRMISHGNGYHSHKHGYACDGMDFWLSTGRVIDRKRYFELMRQKEEALLQGLEKTSVAASKEPEFGVGVAGNRNYIEMAYDGSGIGRMGYKPFSLVDALVITPAFLVSFPRSGGFEYNERNKVWTPETGFSSSNGILKFRSTPTHDDSPFKIYFKTNSLASNVRTISEFQEQSEQMIAALSHGTKAVGEVMPLMEMYVARMNNMNNTAFAKSIERRRKVSA